MSLEITIHIPALDKLVDVIAKGAVAMPSAEGKPAPAAPKATPKATPKADAKPATEATQDAGETATTAASPSDAPSEDEVKKIAMAYNQKNGRDALISLLGKHGAANISALGEDKRAAFIADAQEGIA